VYQAFPQVRTLRKETDGPLTFTNVLGMRAEQSTDRRNREIWHRTTDMGPGSHMATTGDC